MNFAGHYDAIKHHVVLQQHEEMECPAPDNKQTSCRCGQGAKRKSKTVVSCSEYKSGCKCFQNVAACSKNCHCINCNNPRGKRIQAITAQIECSSRKRRHHETSWCLQRTKHKVESTSLKCMLEELQQYTGHYSRNWY